MRITYDKYPKPAVIRKATHFNGAKIRNYYQMFIGSICVAHTFGKQDRKELRALRRELNASSRKRIDVRDIIR